MEAGYSCSDECGCEHCHRIQAAYDAQAARLAAAEAERDQWKDRATVNADKVIAQAARLAYVQAHEADLAAGYLSLAGWRQALRDTPPTNDDKGKESCVRS